MMRGAITVIVFIAAIIMVLSLMFPDVVAEAGTSGAWLALIQILMTGVLVGAGLFSRSGEERLSLSQGLRYGAIWLGILLFVLAAYTQRDNFSALWVNIAG